MENTLENKARFLTHVYADSRLAIKSILGDGITFGIINILNDTKEYYAELTPLSAITDEDAIEVAKILMHVVFNVEIIRTIRYISISHGNDSFCVWFDGEIISDDNEPQQAPLILLSAYDYLRSRGYALPYLDASVEDLVSMGWVKLKTA